jgi:hypothetical protein
MTRRAQMKPSKHLTYRSERDGAAGLKARIGVVHAHIDRVETRLGLLHAVQLVAAVACVSVYVKAAQV